MCSQGFRIKFKYLVILFFLSVSCFSVHAGDGKEVSFETLVKTTKSWDGKDLVSYADGSPEITILKVIVAPGAVVEQHKHPVINAAVILSGELTVVSEHGQTKVFRAGDAVVELVDTLHYGKNTGSVDTEILVFYAGAKVIPLSVKK